MSVQAKGNRTRRDLLHYPEFTDGVTCHQWLTLIEQTTGYDLIYNWFGHLKTKGHFINGYVIMSNHLHVLIAFPNTGQSINTIILVHSWASLNLQISKRSRRRLALSQPGV